MFYGLLLGNSALGQLSNEAVDGKASTRDDESWLLGLEAWVPCFASARTRSETARAIQVAPYGVSSKL